MKKKDFWLILLFLVSLIPLFDFLKPGLPITHDGQDQVARIANFYQSFKEGNLIPRWAGNLNWGYGHPILMFLYPLPSYLASFFRFLNFSLVDSTKIVFALSFILSVVFMYLWIAELWGKEAGLAAGVIYLFAPYRFVDLYVRGALGECWAFVWPPLICYFALKLSKSRQYRYFVGGSLSLAALILSHNALSLMFLPVIFGYMIYLVFLSKQKILYTLYFTLYTFFGFGLSAFFWLPAFFEGKYTLRDVITKNQIVGFEPFSRLIWSAWNYGITGQFSVQIGPLQWLMIAITPILIWKFRQKSQKIWLFLMFLFFCFWLSIFLILPAAKFLYLKVNLMQKFQFAWRWLSLAIFLPAVFSGAVINFLSKKFKLLAVSFLLLASLLANRAYWLAKDFLLKDESFYTQPFASPTDTGESAPIWSVRFMEKFPKAHLEVIDGKAKIEEVDRKVNQHEYHLAVEKTTRFVENTLYFPGWEVFISAKGGPASGRDNQPLEVEFQNPDYRGLMTFVVPVGEHRLLIRFGETKLRQFADLVSLVSILVLVLSLPVLKLIKK